MNLLSANRPERKPEPPAAPSPKPARVSKAQAERALAAELLAEIRRFHQTSTQHLAKLAGGIVNDVLGVETLAIPAEGFVHRAFHVTIGALQVRNLSDTDAVTISSSGPTGSAAPEAGVGVYVVPAGDVEWIHLASRQFTVYGTAAERVSWQALTRSVAA